MEKSIKNEEIKKIRKSIRVCRIMGRGLSKLEKKTERLEGKERIIELCGKGISIKVGNNFLLKDNVPFKIWDIKEKQEDMFDLYFSILTKTSWMILPIVGNNKDLFLWDEAFINSYLYVEGNDDIPYLYLYYRFQDNPKYAALEDYILSLDNYKTHLEVDKYHTLYQMEIPEKYKKVVKLFLEGKYSKFPNTYKEQVLKFHKVMDYALNCKLNVKNTQLYQILYKSPKMKKELEDKLGVTLEKEAEVWSKPIKEKETFLNKYKVSLELCQKKK